MKNNFLKLRRDLKNIYSNALKDSSADAALGKNISLKNNILKIQNKTYALEKFENIYVIGFGKASSTMAKPLENLLGNRISGGLIITKYGHSEKLKKIKSVEAGHPVPDENGVKYSLELIDFLKKVTRQDLVICLVSGGGSALLTLPEPPISLEDKRVLTNLLLNCGADINEINIFRKFISKVKGGKLLNYIYPAASITLICSDIIGNPVDMIASGPTVYGERITKSDIMQIVEKYGLSERIPKMIKSFLKNPPRNISVQTKNKISQNDNFVILDNYYILKKASEYARRLGYKSLILSSEISGDTTENAKTHCAILNEVFKTGNPVKPPCCIISGGETTVKIKGNGLGGRNQEFVLVSLIEMNKNVLAVIASIGTDGTDGPTNAAGALCDSDSYSRCEKMGISPEMYLQNNDSYNLFRQLNDLIITGHTGSNLMDLRIILAQQKY
ncbi:MAG TPA: glycerate kinase [bacterium]|nr:glycerate kinase [bacterium]HPN30263.1 glycerate kinase [bacterium]